MNLNQVLIAGNLTRDPEIRSTPGGMSVCNIGIAVNEKRKDATGAVKESVTFVDATAFGKTADAIGQYLTKGRCILIQGRLKTETWNDKATNKPRSKLVTLIDSFQFADSKGSQSSQGGESQAERPARTTTASAPAPAAVDDDDGQIPF